VKQHLVVTIADPAQRAWGFQLTARLASNTATMAGTFASTDQNTTLMCSSTDFNNFQEVDYAPGQHADLPRIHATAIHRAQPGRLQRHQGPHRVADL
jgi:hypothetical protein